MPNAPSPNDLTRQQLDELDALLQKMLALPGAPAEAPPGGWRAAKPAAVAVAPAPHLTPATADVPEPADLLEALAGVQRSMPRGFAPPAAFAEPDSVPAIFYADTIPVTPAEPVAAPLDAFDSVPLTPAPAVAEQPVGITPAMAPLMPPKPTTPGWLIPLAAVNWVMEKALGLFGPPGQALASPAGKGVLGGAGVLMLLGAAAWTARGMGWIKLPMP